MIGNWRRGSVAALGHHEFVAFGVDAHGEVEGVLGGVVRLGGEGAAAGEELSDAAAEVVELEGEAGPGAFAFAAAVDAEGGTGDDDFAPDFHFEGDGAAEEVAVEVQAALPIGGPEDVFDFEDLHGVREWEL